MDEREQQTRLPDHSRTLAVIIILGLLLIGLIAVVLQFVRFLVTHEIVH